MKILTILGARPQLIKAAPVSISFAKKEVEELILHTGQHYDNRMSDVFLKELGLPMPYKNLGISGGTHGEMTSRMLIRIEEELIDEKPDIVLVYGDTNSTLAGALAAAKLNIPIAHVEAGLRSFNSKMPEEINRILADRVSSFLFCLTQVAVDNLKSEGIVDGVSNVGDVMFDAALLMSKRAENSSSITEKLELDSKPYILATIHRAENTDSISRLSNILSVLSDLSKEKVVVFPIHPRTSKVIKEHKLEHFLSEVTVIEPVSYLEILKLQSCAYAIVTDSGGMQKEAYFNKTPCFTLRDETEWVETVDCGWNSLMSPEYEIDSNQIIKKAQQLPSKWVSYYGDGNASQEITRILASLTL